MKEFVLLAILLIAVFPAPASAFDLFDKVVSAITNAFDSIFSQIAIDLGTQGLCTMLEIRCAGKSNFELAQEAHGIAVEFNNELTAANIPAVDYTGIENMIHPEYVSEYKTEDSAPVVTDVHNYWKHLNNAKSYCGNAVETDVSCLRQVPVVVKGEFGDITTWKTDDSWCVFIIKETDSCIKESYSALRNVKMLPEMLVRMFEDDYNRLKKRGGLLGEYEYISPHPASTATSIRSFNSRMEDIARDVEDIGWLDSESPTDMCAAILYKLKNVDQSQDKKKQWLEYLSLMAEFANAEGGPFFEVMKFHVEAMYFSGGEMDLNFEGYSRRVDDALESTRSKLGELRKGDGDKMDRKMVNRVRDDLAIRFLPEELRQQYPAEGTSPMEAYDAGMRVREEEAIRIFPDADEPLTAAEVDSQGRYGTLGNATIKAKEAYDLVIETNERLDKAIKQTTDLLALATHVNEVRRQQVEAALAGSDRSVYVVQQANDLLADAKSQSGGDGPHEQIENELKAIEKIESANDWLTKPIEEVIKGSLTLARSLQQRCQQTIDDLEKDEFWMGHFTEQREFFEATKAKLSDCNEDFCAHQIYPDFVDVLYDGTPQMLSIQTQARLSVPYTDMLAKREEVGAYIAQYNRALKGDDATYETFKSHERTFNAFEATYHGLALENVLGSIKEVNSEYGKMLGFFRSNYETITKRLVDMIASENTKVEATETIVMGDPTAVNYIINIKNDQTFDIRLEEPIRVSLPVKASDGFSLDKVSQAGSRVTGIKEEDGKLLIHLDSVSANSDYPISVANRAVLVEKGQLTTEVTMDGRTAKVTYAQGLTSHTSQPFTAILRPDYCPSAQKLTAYLCQGGCTRMDKLDEVPAMGSDPCTLKVSAQGLGKRSVSIELEVPDAVNLVSDCGAVAEGSGATVTCELKVTNTLEMEIKDIEISESVGEGVDASSIQLELAGQRVDHQLVGGKLSFTVPNLIPTGSRTYRLTHRVDSLDDYVEDTSEDAEGRLVELKERIDDLDPATQKSLESEYNQILEKYLEANERLESGDPQGALELIFDVTKRIDALKTDTSAATTSVAAWNRLKTEHEMLRKRALNLERFSDAVMDVIAEADRERREAESLYQSGKIDEAAKRLSAANERLEGYSDEGMKKVISEQMGKARSLLDVAGEGISLLSKFLVSDGELSAAFVNATKAYNKGNQDVGLGEYGEAYDSFVDAEALARGAVDLLETLVPNILGDEIQKTETKKREADQMLQGAQSSMITLQNALKVQLGEEDLRYLLSQHSLGFSVPDANLTSETKSLYELMNTSEALEERIGVIKEEGLKAFLVAEIGEKDLPASVAKYHADAKMLEEMTGGRLRQIEDSASASITALTALAERVKKDRKRVGNELTSDQNEQLDALLDGVGTTVKKAEDHLAKGEYMTAYAVASLSMAKIDGLLEITEAPKPPSSNRWMLIPLLLVFGVLAAYAYKQKPMTEVNHVGRPVDRVLREAKKESHLKKELEKKNEKPERKKVLKREEYGDG